MIQLSYFTRKTCLLIYLISLCSLVLSKAHQTDTSNQARNDFSIKDDIIQSEVKYQERTLQDGDLTDLNELLDGIIIALPDVTITEDLPWPFTSLVMTISNMQCSQMSVNKIVTWEKNSDDKTQVDLFFNIMDITIECALDFDYEAGSLGGDGSAILSATSSGNFVQGYYRLQSKEGETFNTHPPLSSDVGACETNFKVSDLVIDSGGIIDDIIDTFVDEVEKALEDFACEELTTIDEVIDEMIIKKLYDLITPYFTVDNDDPLYAEKQIGEIPDDVDLVDWKDDDIDPFFLRAIQRVTDWLGSTKIDQSNSTGTGEDLGLNILIRSFNFFDEDIGGLVFNSSESESESENESDPGLLLKMQDMFTETIISWTQIRVLGLDTFTGFNVMEPLGSYTLQSLMKIKEVDIEIDLTLKMAPSSLELPLIITGTAPNIMENITIRTGIRNVTIEVSTLVALDENKKFRTKLRSILDDEEYTKRLLITVWKMEITQLLASADSIKYPTIDGLIDDGIDTVLNTGARVAMIAYEKSFLRALPGLFQTTIRPQLNTMLQDFLNITVNSTIFQPMPTLSPSQSMKPTPVPTRECREVCAEDDSRFKCAKPRCRGCSFCAPTIAPADQPTVSPTTFLPSVSMIPTSSPSPSMKPTPLPTKECREECAEDDSRLKCAKPRCSGCSFCEPTIAPSDQLTVSPTTFPPSVSMVPTSSPSPSMSPTPLPTKECRKECAEDDSRFKCAKPRCSGCSFCAPTIAPMRAPSINTT